MVKLELFESIEAEIAFDPSGPLSFVAFIQGTMNKKDGKKIA